MGQTLLPVPASHVSDIVSFTLYLYKLHEPKESRARTKANIVMIRLEMGLVTVELQLSITNVQLEDI